MRFSFRVVLLAAPPCTPTPQPDCQWLPRRCYTEPQGTRLTLINKETMSSDTSNSGIMQKADQIAFHFYTKLFYTINQARATEEPHSQGKIDKWVRSNLSHPGWHIVIIHCTVQPRNTRFRPLHEGSPWTLPKHIFITTPGSTTPRNSSTALHTRIDE